MPLIRVQFMSSFTTRLRSRAHAWQRQTPRHPPLKEGIYERQILGGPGVCMANRRRDSRIARKYAGYVILCSWSGDLRFSLRPVPTCKIGFAGSYSSPRLGLLFFAD